MQEIWKPIKGFEGSYEVSNLGRIKSLPKTIYRIVKAVPTPINVGEYIMRPHAAPYQMVTLRANGKPIIRSVHRIVAETFIPNPNNLPQVNHKNEIKTDNRADNLEWCTPSYNIRYSAQRRRERKASKDSL